MTLQDESRDVTPREGGGSTGPFWYRVNRDLRV